MSLPCCSWGIALAPLVVFVTTDVAFYQLGLDNPYIAGLTLDKPPQLVAYYEAAGRYVYLATVLICIGVSTLCVYMLISELFSRNKDGDMHYDQRTVIEAFVIFALLSVPASLWYIITVSDPLWSRIGGDIFVAFFRSCLDAEQSEGCAFGKIVNSRDLPSGLNYSIRSAAVSSIVGAAAAIVGCLLSLSTEHEKYGPTYSLQKRSGVARTFLNLSSALLTAGILSLMAWIQMPVDMIAPNQKQAYLELTRAIGIYFGVSYALTLSSFYVPTQIILNKHKAFLSNGHSAIQGKRRPIEETIERTLAILAPFLAAIASALGLPNIAG